MSSIPQTTDNENGVSDLTIKYTKKFLKNSIYHFLHNARIN